MEPRERFSVWTSAGEAQGHGPDHVTWNGACQEWSARVGAEEDDTVTWYIWDHSAIPPEDVTGGDPNTKEQPSGDAVPWWVCRYSRDGSGYKVSGPHAAFAKEEVGASKTENSGLFVSAIFQCHEKPSYEIFALVVASRLGIILPELKEQQWCWTTEGGWTLMDGNMVNKYSSPEYQRMGNGSELVRVYGTIANREERKDAILKVMREAGPTSEGETNE